MPRIMFYVIFAIAFIGIIFVMIRTISMLNPNRMAKRLKQMGDVVTQVQHDLVSDNKDIMTETANNQADINREAIRKTAQAIKEGFESEKVYCRHCGSVIDADSKFCKNCGNSVD